MTGGISRCIMKGSVWQIEAKDVNLMRLHGSVLSQTLQMDTGLTIVTPNVLWEHYQVAYVLHGLFGNHQSWLDYSMLADYAADGNTVYIMPEVGRSFYCDMTYGFDYFTYITEELPEICGSLFHISAKREDTIVMGASMGGYGALKCALSKPERYGKCAAFSSCCLDLRGGLKELRENGAEEYAVRFGERLVQDFRAIFGEEYQWKPELDVLELAKRVPEGKRPELYLTCGTEDGFYPEHLWFCGQLQEAGVPFAFEEWQAQHNFACFDRALRQAIRRFGL